MQELLVDEVRQLSQRKDCSCATVGRTSPTVQGQEKNHRIPGRFLSRNFLGRSVCAAQSGDASRPRVWRCVNRSFQKFADYSNQESGSTKPNTNVLEIVFDERAKPYLEEQPKVV